jgi:ABC-type Fe3+ transport system permease subunit
LLIISKLEQYDVVGATALAMVMLIISFVLLLAVNGLAVVGGESAHGVFGRVWERASERALAAGELPSRAGCVPCCSGVGLGFLFFFLALPLLAVFVEAFAAGWSAYAGSPERSRNARSAIGADTPCGTLRTTVQRRFWCRCGVGDCQVRVSGARAC